MGCDIHSRAERKVNGKWEVIPGLTPFDWRSYGMFGFLANVRNYSAIPPLSEQRGLPDDAPPVDEDNGWLGEHSFSWIGLEGQTPPMRLNMDPTAKKFIEELRAHAKYETAEWMADPNNSGAPDRKPEDHIAWKASAWLQAIFDPENQPSQFGTELMKPATPRWHLTVAQLTDDNYDSAIPID